METLEAQIKEILCSHLGVEADAIEYDSDIVDDLGANSLEVVEISMDIEETFDVELSDEEILANRTYGDICDFIAAAKVD